MLLDLILECVLIDVKGVKICFGQNDESWIHDSFWFQEYELGATKYRRVPHSYTGAVN